MAEPEKSQAWFVSRDPVAFANLSYL